MMARMSMIRSTSWILINRIRNLKGWEINLFHLVSEDSSQMLTIWACLHPIKRCLSRKSHLKKFIKTSKTTVSIKINRNNLIRNAMLCVLVDHRRANRIKWLAQQASKSFRRHLHPMVNFLIMHHQHLKFNHLVVKLLWEALTSINNKFR